MGNYHSMEGIGGEIDGVISKLSNIKEQAKQRSLSSENEVLAKYVKDINNILGDMEKYLNEKVLHPLEDNVKDGKTILLQVHGISILRSRYYCDFIQCSNNILLIY